MHYIINENGEEGQRKRPWGFLCSDGIWSKLCGTLGYLQSTYQPDKQFCHKPYTSGLFLQMPLFLYLLTSPTQAMIISLGLSPRRRTGEWRL